MSMCEMARSGRGEGGGRIEENFFPGDIAKYKTSQFKPNRNNKTFKILIKV